MGNPGWRGGKGGMGSGRGTSSQEWVKNRDVRDQKTWVLSLSPDPLIIANLPLDLTFCASVCSAVKWDSSSFPFLGCCEN